jgi:hypothetical protein
MDGHPYASSRARPSALPGRAGAAYPTRPTGGLTRCGPPGHRDAGGPPLRDGAGCTRSAFGATGPPHGSGSSNGSAWARRRISSIITEHIVMASRHDRARSGRSCSVTSRTSATRSAMLPVSSSTFAMHMSRTWGLARRLGPPFPGGGRPHGAAPTYVSHLVSHHARTHMDAAAGSAPETLVNRHA